MMISPEYYRKTIENCDLSDLIKERDILLSEIDRYKKRKIKVEEKMMAPSPEVIYKCNLDYLAIITDLIDRKSYELALNTTALSSISNEYSDRYSTRSFRNNYCEQALKRSEDRPKHVQAYVSNIAFPDSLEALEEYAFYNGYFDHEGLLKGDSETNWTAPKWTKIGDIVFFMHAKYAIKTITKLRTKLTQSKSLYSDVTYSELMKWINKGIDLHKQIGGKIFAIAQVCGTPEYIGGDEEYGEDILHFKSRIYVDMDHVTILDNPIDIDEFRSFITISRQSAITPVLGDDFNRLKKLIASKNQIPAFLRDSDATPLPLTYITGENWMSISNDYRRAFMLESQFRSYYVNYLLKAISDRKTIWKECRCRKAGIPDSFIDNVIFIDGKYLPVEVKLSIHAQSDIKGQVKKYCDDDYILLDGKENKRIKRENIYSDCCMIIDTDYVYMYCLQDDSITPLLSLDSLKTVQDLLNLKSVILKNINTHSKNQ